MFGADWLRSRREEAGSTERRRNMADRDSLRPSLAGGLEDLRADWEAILREVGGGGGCVAREEG